LGAAHRRKSNRSRRRPGTGVNGEKDNSRPARKEEKKKKNGNDPNLRESL